MQLHNRFKTFHVKKIFIITHSLLFSAVVNNHRLYRQFFVNYLIASDLAVQTCFAILFAFSANY
jgi:hypothetical protein